MDRDVDLILRHPYASPRATYLSFLMKHHKKLIKEGIALNTLKRFIDKIENDSAGSEITQQICIPAARKVVV